MKKLFVTSMILSLFGITAFGQEIEREFKHVEMSTEQPAPEIPKLTVEIVHIEGRMDDAFPEMDKLKTMYKQEILGVKEE